SGFAIALILGLLGGGRSEPARASRRINAARLRHDGLVFELIVQAPEIMEMNIADRYRGAMLGLAVGDALGTTLEFSPPGSSAPIGDMGGGGPFRLPAGAWTDDTSMALCLAESLVACGGFDAADQMRRYVRWYREGEWSSTGHCFDIGNTTCAALEQFEET